jgi:Ice-binding-like
VVIAAVAVVVTAGSANPSEHWASQHRYGVCASTAPTVVDLTPPPVHAPKAPPVVVPEATPVVVPTPRAVVVPKAPPVVGQTPSPASSSSPAPVKLGTAGTFAVLTKTGITDVSASAIRGDVGASPITGAAIGLTCSEVTGTIYTVSAAGPLPCRLTDAPRLTTAVHDEEAAYTDAAGRTNPAFVDLGAEQIGGLTLAPGLYKWTTGVSISNDVTLTGGPNDVWIFQVGGPLTQAVAAKVTLSGGALAKNVFWQAAGAVDIGAAAHFEGTILSQTMIAMKTGASMNGRLLAQTAVTLQKNVVTNVR